MKTLVIKALSVALVAGAAEACANYGQCRCTMANGQINNTATSLATEYLNHNIQVGYTPYTDFNDTVWVIPAYSTGNGDVDNCAAREACAAVGATGNDSWCEKKNK